MELESVQCSLKTRELDQSLVPEVQLRLTLPRQSPDENGERRRIILLGIYISALARLGLVAAF